MPFAKSFNGPKVKETVGREVFPSVSVTSL